LGKSKAVTSQSAHKIRQLSSYSQGSSKTQRKEPSRAEYRAPKNQ